MLHESPTSCLSGAKNAQGRNCLEKVRENVASTPPPNVLKQIACPGTPPEWPPPPRINEYSVLREAVPRAETVDTKVMGVVPETGIGLTLLRHKHPSLRHIKVSISL